MKKFLMIFTMMCSFFILTEVNAGTLSWKNFKKLSPNTFEFYLEATDLEINYISGTWEIENGRILEIKTTDGWINATNNNNTFYYYHDGIKKGNYQIATIKIELTKDGTTKINNLKMDIYTCTKDAYLNFFNPNGNLTTETEYKNACLNNDATLKNLIISEGTLSPKFQSNINNYSATVNYDTDKMIFNPILNNQKAKIISNNTCNLKVGKNTCEIIIEAENGIRNTYTVEVTRKELQENPNYSDDATLKSLAISNGILIPDFDSNIFSYTTNVKNEISVITWDAIPNHPKAKVLTNSCNLTVGENTCEIIVEAENKSKKTYYLFVTREKKTEEENNDTTIKNLTVENGTLIEKFDPLKKEYTIEINENTKSIILKYTLNANNEEKELIINIEENKKYYDLIITSLNNQIKDTYRFNFSIKKNQNNTENKDDQKPIIKDDNEIENPQTGINLSFKSIISLIGLSLLAFLCFKKKNIIKKI